MAPQARRLFARLPAARIPAGVVSASAAISAAAHVAAAAMEPAVAMACWMAAMGAVCLACAAPLVTGRRCAGRAAGHLMTMSAAMVLIHTVLLTAPGGRAHHGAAAGGGAAAFAPHEGTMLALIGVELVCLTGASVALRLARSAGSR